ncbi:MAG: hypothetical protein Q4E24_03765 [bacterium]|nr:hypothetical protein [bacterium]
MNHPLLTEDIGVHFLNMPTKVKEQVVFNEDGSFTIFINARLTYEQQMQAYQHALLHIMEHDFEKESADDIEKAM